MFFWSEKSDFECVCNYAHQQQQVDNLSRYIAPNAKGTKISAGDETFKLLAGIAAKSLRKIITNEQSFRMCVRCMLFMVYVDAML